MINNHAFTLHITAMTNDMYLEFMEALFLNETSKDDE